MNILPDPTPAQFWLVVSGPGTSAAESMLELAARLAWLGPLRVLDCGNCFQAFHVARHLRQALSLRPAPPGVEAPRPGVTLQAMLARLQVARAFTCYQALALLESAPCGTHPTLVLELLATFYDESVPARESQRLLKECILQLKRLSRQRPLVVSARPASAAVQDPDRAILIELLQDAADRVVLLQALPAPDPQLAFPFMAGR